MLINSMQYDNFSTRPIVLGDNTVERVTYSLPIRGDIIPQWRFLNVNITG